MGENVIEDVQKALEGVTDEDLATWARENYNLLVAVCEEKGLPKPPPW